MALLTYKEYLAQVHADGKKFDPRAGGLVPVEQFWKEFQPWLLEHGYKLRPRYDPNWIPSWKGTKKRPWECEDNRRMQTATLLDAIRISDNARVVMKSVWRDAGPQEVSILELLTQEELELMPDNHSVPVIDVLDIPNHEHHQVVVMPLLRPFDDPPMRTTGEAVDFFRQIFAGLKFLHDRNIAHRDCCGQNIMMESVKLYPEGFDFLEMEVTEGRVTTREQNGRLVIISSTTGGDKTAPEHAILVDGQRVPCDTFPTDIYYLGNLIKTQFVEPNVNFGFMRSLANDMTQQDPAERPNIDAVVKRFNDIMARLSWFRLRSRIIPRSDIKFPPIYLVKEIIHVFRTASYILRSLPPLPPSPAPRLSYGPPEGQ